MRAPSLTAVITVAASSRLGALHHRVCVHLPTCMHLLSCMAWRHQAEIALLSCACCGPTMQRCIRHACGLQQDTASQLTADWLQSESAHSVAHVVRVESALRLGNLPQAHAGLRRSIDMRSSLQSYSVTPELRSATMALRVVWHQYGWQAQGGQV